MNLVVDCSFIMSSILPDEQQKNIEDIYNNIADNTYKVFVPAIFYLECNNVLISSLKRKRIAKDDYEEYLNLLSILPLHIDNFCSTPESLYALSNLSNKYSLTSYDASYLEVAIRMNASIATLDKNLNARCREAGVESII